VAAHVLRLRLALLFGALRGDVRHVLRVVAVLLVLAALVGAACWALLTLRDADIDVVFAVTVLGGSAITLGFAFAPLIGGVDDPLDPRRFALFGLPHAPLAMLLAAVGLVSVPMLALTAVGVTSAVVWVAQGVSGVLAAAGVVLGVVTCSLLARVCAALAAMFLRERRSRELTGVFVLVVLVVVVPVGVFLSSLEWKGTVPSQLGEAASILAVTPIGAAWALPGVSAAGEGSPWLTAIAAVATIAVLLGGSALLLLDRALWLGAGALVVFLLLTILVVHRFWALPEPQAKAAMFWALEHISLVGGLFAAAIASRLRRRLEGQA